MEAIDSNFGPLLFPSLEDDDYIDMWEMIFGMDIDEPEADAEYASSVADRMWDESTSYEFETIA